MLKNNTRVPIFIISQNRLEVLKKTIESFQKKISFPNLDIIVHDICSTFEPTLDYLNKINNTDNIKVFFDKENGQFTRVQSSIDDYFKKVRNCDYYIVTDPDIELEETNNNNILEFYSHILDKNSAHAVGPMLRIDDIPEHYPLKQRVVNLHTKDFWSKDPKTIKFNDTIYRYVNAPIASTFAMYRKKTVFSKIKPAVRTLSPYQARHLDWYLDLDNLSEDQIYYMKNAEYNGHWGAQYLRGIQKEEKNE